MLHRDPRCVLVTDTMAIAVVAATWLTDNDIAAQVMDQNTLGGLEGLTSWLGVSARGLEVWVDDPARVDEARALLAEHEAALAQRASEAEQRGPTEVVCEECGQSSVFPAEQYGTTQECPKCNVYVDVEEPGSRVEVEGDAEEGDEPEED